MSLLNTLAAWQWILLGAIPVAIVLLYFLKLKRLPLEVPSTYLWRRTIEDLHVNSIWQRLRRNLLLFLQILLVILILLALLRPGWRGTQLTGDRFIFLIDNSASMSATDVRPSRLERAKQQTLELVDQMKSGDVAMVISFSDTAQVVQTYTESRRVLRRRIKGIPPTRRATDLHEALRAAAGLANPGFTRLRDNQALDEAMPATLYMLSDGGFRDVPDFSLGNLDPEFLPVGKTAAENVGIVAFAADRNPEKPDRMQAFTSVRNFGDREVTVDLELFLDGESLDIAELTIAAGAETRWHFELPDLEEGALQVALDWNDALAADNVAYAAVNQSRPAKVLLVTPGNEPLRLALRTDKIRDIADVALAEPPALGEAGYQGQAATGAYDLIIYDRCSPQQLPQANTLFIGSLPPGDAWKAGKRAGPPQIIDIDRVHPLTQLVEMDNVKIAEGTALTPPPGSTVLFDSVIGPLFAIAPRAGLEDAVLGFPLLEMQRDELVPNTTWPLRPSFPVFMYNVVRYLGGSRGATAVTSVSPGSPVTMRLPASVRRVTVVSPSGKRRELRREGPTPFVYTWTETPGIYELFQESETEPSRRFVVNLFDERESDITPETKLELGHETVVGQVQLQAVRRELWKAIVIFGLLVLIFEWYVYNRRVYL